MTRQLIPLALILLLAACNTAVPSDPAEPVQDKPYEPMHNIDNLLQARAALIPYPRKVRWLEGSYGGEQVEETLEALPFSDSPEAYSLKVTPEGVQLRANSPAGLVYARTTLRQLGDDGGQHYPVVEIEDYPAYAIRGVMHDVGRNFQSIDYLKQQLRKLAYYKINTFHWHLSDHPGWRIESIRFPELNAPENYRASRDPGKYYSYDEIRGLIAYARELNIQVIPELDMPGHSKFFKQTFGFGMGSWRGRKICAELLEEFFQQVPGELAPYIHLGSDEVFIPFPGHFVKTMEQVAHEYGRTPIVWKPGLDSAQDTLVQVWSSAAFDPESGNIDSTDFYTNGMDPLNSFQRVYFKQIVGTATGDDRFALGGIIATWNDVNVDEQEHVLRNNPFYLTALTGAEVMWNGNPTGSHRYQTQYPPRGSLERSMIAEFEQRLLHHRAQRFTADEFFYVPQEDAQWTITAADGSSQKAGGVTVILRRRHTGEGLFPQAEPGDEATATRTIHSEEKRDAWLHVGLAAPYRSHRKWQGIPAQGEWDAFGASVALNGNTLAPPVWQEPEKFQHLKATWHQPVQEEPWREEELYWLRQPVRVTLQAGANRFDIKTRYAYPEQHWQVALWLTDDDGRTL